MRRVEEQKAAPAWKTALGTATQWAALVGVICSGLSYINSRDARGVADAAAAGANTQLLAELKKADEVANVRFQRIWDFLPPMRRDIESEFRRDIDSACQCCRK